MYIPLGGTKNVAVATILIFTFVALWHGVAFHLLAWGWIVSLFILPELLAAYFLPSSKVRLGHMGLYKGLTKPHIHSTGIIRGTAMFAPSGPYSIYS